MNISLTIRAQNNISDMDLHITSVEDEIHITAFGKHEGNDVQIDFDSLDEHDVKRMVLFLGSHLENILEKRDL